VFTARYGLIPFIKQITFRLLKVKRRKNETEIADRKHKKMGNVPIVRALRHVCVWAFRNLSMFNPLGFTLFFLLLFVILDAV
jgi:hypothetical protein